MRRPRPRTLLVLAVCLALLGTGVYAGVRWAQAWKGSVTLLANWSGAEREQFEENVIEPFEDEYRIDVVYQGSSALSQVLAADIAAGNPPDVAVLPGPGELLAYAVDGRLHPLDGLFDRSHYDGIWAPEVTVPGLGGHTYWLPVKTGLKSMVWYAGDRPTTRSAAGPERWCLGMESGATSGWPGTDWVEDILLQQAGPAVYADWANGRLPWTDAAVRKAWTTWGEMAGAGGRRAEEALTAGFGADCAPGRLEHQGSFRAGHWQRAGGDYVHFAEVVPDAGPRAGAWEVSGDLAALLDPTPEARQLIRYLADPGTALPQHTANKAAPEGGQGGTADEVGKILRGETGGSRCWDASDVMPRATRDAFHQAVLRYLVEPEGLDDRLRELEELDEVEELNTGQELPVCGGG
ncbi:ABC transporter substrate-binding protein [Streptomyces sp.]|uniref:ABC transporter substrate-binding protein n=1 Tax=Streptomyces sp. TaxID=1931 RepID=UPI002D6FE905|nr:extracellular solute-binding protein [Streptomyces sp.]HZF88753.1 extracellular solute-binding protein [Streptomyces sp.]